jgi:hypothetical protein
MRLSQSDSISSSLSSALKLSISIAGRDMGELYRLSSQCVSAKIRESVKLTSNA